MDADPAWERADDSSTGLCAPGYERVRDAFVAPFESGREIGGAVCVTVRGEPVVDLWAGHADAKRTRPWQRDTLCMPYSVSKAMVASCAMILWDRGDLDLEDRVRRYWPEFGRAGKEALTVRMLLCHQAGVVAVDEPLPPEAMLDWERITSALAAARPRWQPGTAHGESARFYGHLVGELVRRIDGRSLGRFFREEVAVPVDIDFHFGLGEAELARCADMVAFRPEVAAEVDRTGAPFAREATSNPPGMRDEDVINAERFRRAEVPAINGHGTARGVARFYAMLAAAGTLDGRRVLSEGAVDAMLEVQRVGPDLVTGIEKAAWALGVQRLPGGAFGMGGLGGHLGLGHREHGVGVGYVKNRLGLEEPGEAVLVALARCIAERGASGHR